jgi:hypothetical protein
VAVPDIDLADLWKRVRSHLDAADDAALGEVRVGRAEANEKPWAMTNDGEDKVNLTLETKEDQLELNLVGWNEAQSDALKDWLQSVEGEKVVNALDGYEVVAFVRRAYKKTPQSRPWWQGQDYIELGKCPAAEYNPGWVVRKMIGLKSKKEEKPAFHFRRRWSWARADELGDDLPRAIATEVRRVLLILRHTWLIGADRAQ